MSIKKLFNKNKSSRTITKKPNKKLSVDTESEKFIEAKSEAQVRYSPHILYGTGSGDFSNFVKYGTAERYFDDAIKRIYTTYPYDGSLYEKEQWTLSSSQLDLFILENHYPRTNGHVNISAAGWGSLGSDGITVGYGHPNTLEYIKFYGGPTTGSATKISKHFELDDPGVGSNIYESYSELSSSTGGEGGSGTRESNLKFDVEDFGVTVEFWLKKSAFATAKTEKEVIFDLWNGETPATTGYGRFRIEVDGTATGSPFLISCQSGSSAGFVNQVVGSALTTGSLEDWSHYAVSLKNDTSTNKIRTRLYVNGTLNHERSLGNTIGEVTGSLIANIGALRAATTSATVGTVEEGYGKLSGSMDEFRYWKSERSIKEVGRHWWKQFAGGTNTDLANTTLGVYYKFNEGITGTSSIDQTVLDYSGRLTNGHWIGYPGSAARSLDSAIVLASAADSEFKDPIIYSNHSEVLTLISDLKTKTKEYDDINTSSIISTIPTWILEYQENEAAPDLQNLVQIIASEFDSLHTQIGALTRLKEVKPLSENQSSIPFTDRILENYGFIAPDIFANAELISKIMTRTENNEFKADLVDIKNRIYHNIYNNLINVYKAKGTEKAFRNLIRCFGVDEKLVRFNLYGDNATYKFEDNIKTMAKTNRYANFYATGQTTATVVQQTASSNANSLSYITGSKNINYEPNSGMTVDAEFFFPRHKLRHEDGYVEIDFATASLFGLHTVGEDPEDYTFLTADAANFQVTAVRNKPTSRNAYFELSCSSPFPLPTLTSSLYHDVYDDERWNFSVRLRPSKDPISTLMHGADYVAATAIITTVAEASINDTKDFTLTDAAGITTTYNISTGLATTDNNVAYAPAGHDSRGPSGTITIGVLGTTTAADIRDEIITRINAGTSIGFTASASGDNVLVTQNIAGTAGNTSITEPDGATGLTLPSAFTGGLGIDSPFIVEFHGLNMVAGTVLNEFLITGSVNNASGSNFLKSSKRFYMGAHRTNFTGSVLTNSDMESTALRYWPVYYGSPDEFKNRVRDIDNFGTLYAHRNATFLQKSLKDLEIPQAETLALNWDLSTLTTSDATGEFAIIDASSGSTELSGRYRWVSDIVERQHTGIGYGFPTNATSSIKIRYINSAESAAPETVASSDMVNILTQDDDVFTRQHRPVNYYFAIEKSMYQTISDEVINMFASIVDFNNLVGDPVNRYRQEYKDLEKLRQMFFERIGNTPELDKYIEFYRWVDSGINEMLESLIPASVNSSEGVRTIVESHILERNKYWNKFPTLEMVGEPPTVGLRGIGEMLYPWKEGHAPVGKTTSTTSTVEESSCFWWDERSERGSPATTSGVASVDTQRETIREVIGKHRDGTRIVSKTDNTTYSGSTYAVSRFSKPYRFAVQEVQEIHGGTNYHKEKDLDFVRIATHHHGEDNSMGFPDNVILYDDKDVIKQDNSSKVSSYDLYRQVEGRDGDCNDLVSIDKPWPLSKQKFSYHATVLKNQEYGPDTSMAPAMPPADILSSYHSSVKGDMASPFNLYGTTEEVTQTGYHKEISASFKTQLTITNIHEDSYGNNERPMQGPFTNAHVGGRQNRHIDLNTGDDHYTDRPEAWRFLMGPSVEATYGSAVFTATNLRLLGLVGPDYPHPLPAAPYKPSTWHPRANYMREETAKRPLNISNIKYSTNSVVLGNYKKDYDIVQASSRHVNNRALNKSGGFEYTVEDSHYFIETTSEYKKPERLRSEHIFVTRFSAPGGPETAGDHRGGFGLDFESAEHSAYNTMNYRSLILRGGGRWPDGIRELLTNHTKQFGYFSDQMNISNGAAAINIASASVSAFDYKGRLNFHRTNRNTGYRILSDTNCTEETINYNNYSLYFHDAPIGTRWPAGEESNYLQYATIPSAGGISGNASRPTFLGKLDGKKPFAISTWLKPYSSKATLPVTQSDGTVNMPHSNKRRVVFNLGNQKSRVRMAQPVEGSNDNYNDAGWGTLNPAAAAFRDLFYNFQVHLEPGEGGSGNSTNGKIGIIAPFTHRDGHWSTTGSVVQPNEWTHVVVVYHPDHSLRTVAVTPNQNEGNGQVEEQYINDPGNNGTVDANEAAALTREGSPNEQDKKNAIAIGWKGDNNELGAFRDIHKIDEKIRERKAVADRAIVGANPLLKVYINGILVASWDRADSDNTFGFYLNSNPIGTSLPFIGEAFLGIGTSVHGVDTLRRGIREFPSGSTAPLGSDHPDQSVNGYNPAKEWSYYGLMDETSFWSNLSNNKKLSALEASEVLTIYTDGPNDLKQKLRGADGGRRTMIAWYRFHDQNAPSRLDRINGDGTLFRSQNRIVNLAAPNNEAYTSVEYGPIAVQPEQGGFSASTDLPGQQYIVETCAPVTSAYYDNWYVTHEIPRTEAQYAWISQSVVRDSYGTPVNEIGNSAWGHPPADGKMIVRDPTSDNYLREFNAIQFMKTSELGSAKASAGANRQSGWSQRLAETNSAVEFHTHSFAQLNINLFEPFTGSSQTLGQPADVNISQYGSRIAGDTGYAFALHTAPQGPKILNMLIHKRQGPYGWPSWKQIKGAEHPIVRNYLRKENYLSIVNPPPERYIQLSASAAPLLVKGISNRGDTFKQYREPPIVSNNPMIHVVDDSVVIVHPYSNAIGKFSNQEVNNLLGTKADEETAYSSLVKKYTGDDPTLKFNYLSYQETVFPKQTNRYRKIVRDRENYVTNFWQQGRDNRRPILWAPPEDTWSNSDQINWRIRNNKTPTTLVDAPINISNSQGYVLSHATDWTRFSRVAAGIDTEPILMNGYITSSIGAHSIWPLDARADILDIVNPTANGPSDRLPNGLGDHVEANLKYREVGFPIRENVGSTSGTPMPPRPLWSASLDPSINYRSDLCGELQDYRVQARALVRGVPIANAGSVVEQSHMEPLIPHAQYARRHTTNSTCSFQAPSGYGHGMTPSQWNSGSYSRNIWTYSRTSPGTSTMKHHSVGGYGLVHGTFVSGAMPWHFNDRTNQDPNGIFTYSGQTPWMAGAQAGKSPAYDTYEDFSLDFRSKAKGYSIVPEFRISEHLEYYVNEKNSDFLASNLGLFDLSGSSIKNSQEESFYKTYSHTDFMKHFDVVLNDHSDVTDGPTELTLKCSAILKLLPYDGFYPMQRTLQLATLFSSSYSPKVTPVEGEGSFHTNYGGFHFNYASGSSGTGAKLYATGAVNQSTWAVYLRPFFAPGIMYNTIKSGIAVDYPIMTGSYETMTGSLYLDGHTAGGGEGVNFGPSEDINEHSGLFLTGALTNTITSPRFHYRIPFEAMIEPDKYLVGLPITNMETHPSGAFFSDSNGLSITGSLQEAGGALYKMAANNFFAEVPEFFLNDGRLSAIASLPESDENFGVVDEENANKKFMALLKIRKSVEKKMYFNPLSGAHTVFENDGTTYNKNAFNNPLRNDKPIAHPWTLSRETITMYSRPSAFGPPSMGLWGSITGYNMPYTPPYYDGESWAILTFEPDKASGAKKYTLDEILAATTVQYTRTGKIYCPDQAPSASDSQSNVHGHMDSLGEGFVSNWPWSGPADLRSGEMKLGAGTMLGTILKNNYNWAHNVARSVDPYPQGRTFIDDNAMQVSASLNIFQKARLKSAEYNAITGRPTTVADNPRADLSTWVIQTKFETPILNFQDAKIDYGATDHSISADRNTSGQYTAPDGAASTLWNKAAGVVGQDGSSAKGMWHQYGVLPQREEDGIFMEIQDLSSDYLHRGMNISPGKVRSLSDLVGFSTDPVKLGRPAKSKQISEAVVAVPFVEKNGERHFFGISKENISRAKIAAEVGEGAASAVLGAGIEQIGQSVIDMVEKMQRFVIPPTMNFLEYDSISPFAMYIFEFTHNLDQTDLTDIWQNLLPEIGRTHEEQTAEITHPLIGTELMGCEALASGQKIQDQLQWMVFKIKQKAKTNYYEKVVGSEEAKFNFGLKRLGTLTKKDNPVQQYSYNWPYDYFSLVEVVKVNSTIKFDASDTEESPITAIRKLSLPMLEAVGLNLPENED